MSNRAWSLVIGSDDVSDVVSSGAVFVEVASSANGSANFSIAGNRSSVVVGATVTLTRNAVTLWEGTVASVTPQTDASGNTIALLVGAAPLAAQLLPPAPVIVTSPTDVGQIAAQVVGETTLTWGGLATYGVEPGTLNINGAADGLAALALLVNKNWRVQNGTVIFVDGTNGIAAIAAPFTVAQQAYPTIVVHGGLDANAQTPLLAAYPSPTVTTGQPRQTTIPEISDSVTLDLAGNVLVQRYGTEYQSGFVSLPAGFQGRAGDWVSDTNGIDLPIQQLTYSLLGGDFVAKMIVGFPPLQVTPQYSVRQAAAYAAAPPTRLHGDYLISGGTISIAGVTASFTPASISLSDTQYNLAMANLTLPATGTVQINATPSGFVIAPYIGQPAAGAALPLYLVTMGQATPGIIALYSRGYVASANVLPNAIQSSHVSPQAVQAVHVLPTRYSTDLNNLAYTAAQEWGSIALARDVTGTDVLANGDTLVWDVGTATDSPGDPAPAFSQSLQIAASATITARFKHQAFVTGGIGVPIVLFTGSSASGSGNVQASSSVSGNSTPLLVLRGNRYAQYVLPIAGTPVNYTTPSNTVAPGASTPLVLTLSTLTTPSDGNGASGITVTLKDPGGTVRQTWANQQGPGPKTFTFNAGGFAAGAWTWTIQGVIVTNNQLGASNYSVSWSGNQSYYIPGVAGGAVYILAADGSTQRTAVSDDNVKFTKQTYNDTEFQITNSAPSALTFTLGFDISGL